MGKQAIDTDFGLTGRMAVVGSVPPPFCGTSRRSTCQTRHPTLNHRLVHHSDPLPSLPPDPRLGAPTPPAAPLSSSLVFRSSFLTGLLAGSGFGLSWARFESVADLASIEVCWLRRPEDPGWLQTQATSSPDSRSSWLAPGHQRLQRKPCG